MTDREMVEEMAKITNFTAFDYRQGTIQSKTIYTAMAEALYNANYRKLPEGAVVLTKGAYESISSKAKANVVNAVEIRKETAREILKELITNCQYTFNSVGKPIIALNGDFALNTSKRYGVDIEE